MRIASFWAKGFRSLRDVRLDDLGAFNVFYGPNGGGKSNILAAIQAWLRLSAIMLDPDIEPLSPTDPLGQLARGKLALNGSDAPVHRHDFALGSSRPRLSLEGTLADVSPEIARARIAVRLDATSESRPSLSNLFDLDPEGYFDVSLKNGETVVTRKPLDVIDRDHLYEPGPAKHALQRMLQHMPPDEIMFRDKDGSPISAAKMLEFLREDNPLAVDFLKDVHGAAVTMVKVAKKKGK